MSKKHYTNVTITNLPDREVEIVAEISSERMAELREKAIKKLAENVEIQGFRKGNAPESLVAQKVGEMRLLEEAAEIALAEEYPNILDEHQIDAIGRPQITVTKLAPGNPLGFTAKTALAPEVKLGEYKKIAAKENAAEKKEVEVSEKEIEDVVKTIRENVAHQKMHEEGGHSHNDHSHGEIKEEDLPEVTDEFVKMVGNFENVENFRAKVKENVLNEKKIREKDKRRTDILEKILEKSTIEVPKIIIDSELDKMLAQMKDDLARSGIPYDEYLKHVKKTEEDMRGEWKETAKKRAQSQIALSTIAKEQAIEPKEEEVKQEMEYILAHHKDADRFRVRMFVESFLSNEMVFKFLEDQK